MSLDYSYERKYWQNGKQLVFGVDEAGRGCLAGPVCAAVYAFAPGDSADTGLTGLTDSKKLNEARREALFEPVQAVGRAYGVGMASSKEIDEYNIYQATCLAVMRAWQQAFLQLERPVAKDELVFIADGKLSLVNKGRELFRHPKTQNELSALAAYFPVVEECVIKGDSKVASVAAASILAKVTRDRHMVKLDRDFPKYQFAAHKGYVTKAHKELLAEHGPCREHRFSYAPVRALL